MLTATTPEPDALAPWPEAVARLEDMSLEQVECLLIKRAMARFEGNVSKAARSLGLSRSALYRRLQRYGI
jgi:transcriptional regulator of acetoin/glycerol metabolism